jgi:hypothetical protein
MPPPPHQKPENVLKRAQELDDVGQTSAALSSLYDFIIAKRSRSVPVASLEPVMLRLVELSVEQKKGKIAKDALYQYKNISQNTNIGTIEVRPRPRRLPDDSRLTNSPVGSENLHSAGSRQGHLCTAESR